MRALVAALLGPRWRAVRLTGFAAYALLLFTGTHWPALDIRTDVIERPDLAVHFVAFGLWTLALWQSGLAGDPLRAKSVGVCVPIGVVYAAFDEGLQAIPALRRTCAWDDYAFNCIGVLIGAGLALGLAAILRPQRGASA